MATINPRKVAQKNFLTSQKVDIMVLYKDSYDDENASMEFVFNDRSAVGMQDFVSGFATSLVETQPHGAFGLVAGISHLMKLINPKLYPHFENMMMSLVAGDDEMIEKIADDVAKIQVKNGY